jgi:TRAP-type C4-dicarboxylate transport system permease small subunit
VFARLQQLQARLERGCSFAAAVALFVMMLIVTLDVGLRYFANEPLTWSHDFVSLYLTISLFFLALARTMAEEGHIRVDLLHKYMSARTIRVFEIVNSLLAAGLFALIGVLGYLQTLTQYEGSEVIASSVNWPTWMSTVFVPIGAGLMTLRLLLAAAGHFVTLWSGRELIPLPSSGDVGDYLQVAE